MWAGTWVGGWVGGTYLAFEETGDVGELGLGDGGEEGVGHAEVL